MLFSGSAAVAGGSGEQVEDPEATEGFVRLLHDHGFAGIETEDLSLWRNVRINTANLLSRTTDTALGWYTGYHERRSYDVEVSVGLLAFSCWGYFASAHEVSLSNCRIRSVEAPYLADENGVFHLATDEYLDRNCVVPIPEVCGTRR